jgi:hypothetical protein
MVALYALLCGMLIYVAILSAFGRRMSCNRWSIAFGSLALAVSFAVLTLGTSGVVKHGQLVIVTRLGFAGYAVSLAFIIGRYWREAWVGRRER